MKFVCNFIRPPNENDGMNKSNLNKKSTILCVATALLLVGMAYSTQFFVHSISAKTGTPDKTTKSNVGNNSVDTNNKNNAIILNALELKNETYRWQNRSEGINPTLHLIAHTDYVIKIKNPTDAKHELIIGSNGTELATSKDINPGKNRNFVFNPNSTGLFEYHCEYHPDTMKGVIEITNQ